MYSIKKFSERMTSRERVLRTFNFEKTDRIPIDYQANGAIHMKLAQALGIPDGNDELLRQKLGVDFRMAWVDYKGPLVFEKKEGLNVDPMLGAYMKWVDHGSGGYWECCNYPLMNADPEVIANYPVISADHFDYDTTIGNMGKWDEYAVFAGHAGIADIINTLSRLMGMEDALVNVATEDEATLIYVDKLLDMQLNMLERLIQKSKRIDFLHIGEDLGTQIAPMVSPEVYRRVLKPRHQRFVELAKAYNLPVMIHSCGSSSWAFEDFISMGIGVVDTLQPEVVNMSPAYLKQNFGGRLVFHGCISTAGPLAYGTVNDIISNVKETLDIMVPGGGYCFAPTHMIQDNTPVENVIAMYQAANDYGEYR